MICADWVRDEEWLLDTIIGRVCVLLKIPWLPPGKILSLVLMAALVCDGRDRTGADTHLLGICLTHR